MKLESLLHNINQVLRELPLVVDEIDKLKEGWLRLNEFEKKSKKVNLVVK